MTGERRSDAGRLAGPTRRQILASVGAVGVAGTFTGAGTYALFGGRRSYSGSIQTGGVGIGVELDCESDDTACSASDDGRLSFGFDGIEPGDSGWIDVSLRAEENPARLWLATVCPPAYDPLGESIRVWIQPTNWDGVTQVPETGTWTLPELKRKLHRGIRLGEGCLSPSDRRPLAFRLHWSFDYEADASLAGATTELTLHLHADQCRHVPERAAINPFADREACPEVCAPCTSRLSEVTMEYLGTRTADVAVVAPSGGVEAAERLFPADGSDSIELGPGARFAFDATATGQPEAAFYVDGEKNGQLHTSCSDPIAPGVRVGDFRLVAAKNGDGVALCDDLECVECEKDSDVGGLLVRYDGDEDAVLRAYADKREGQGENGGLQGLLFDGRLSPGEEFFLEASSREGNSSSGSAFGRALYLVADGEREVEVRCDPGPLSPVAAGDLAYDPVNGFAVVAAYDPFGFPFCGGSA